MLQPRHTLRMCCPTGLRVLCGGWSLRVLQGAERTHSVLSSCVMATAVRAWLQGSGRGLRQGAECKHQCRASRVMAAAVRAWRQGLVRGLRGKRARARARTGVGVVRDGGGEADAGGAAAGGGDGQRRDGHDRAQQLRLGHARVAHHQAVDVAAQVRAVRQVALPAAAPYTQLSSKDSYELPGPEGCLGGVPVSPLSMLKPVARPSAP